MLSYRHVFHAGNFADVLKHLVQVEILNYLKQKEKPFVYIDTHAGAGLYSLNSDMAGKTAEFQQGIAALKGNTWPELAAYLQVVNAIAKQDKKAKLYPGSPAIAQHLLREQDCALLFDLHPTDFALLEQNMRGDKRIKVQQQDGFKGLLAALPPVERRALVLIDPPYEIKTDYDTVVEVLVKAHKRFATGTYALWYPVVERARVELIEQRLQESGMKNIQLFEMGLSADTEKRGMTSAGMIVINPPWTLKTKLDGLLPKLTKLLSHGQGVYRSETLVGE